MKTILIISILTLQLGNSLIYTQDQKPLKALILTGQCQRWHNWEESSRQLKNYLIDTKIFSIDMAISPQKGSDMKGFAPDFKNYDVIVIDYEGDNWPETTINNFIEYVYNGGGVVFIHTAFAAINGYKEFDEIVGLRTYQYDNLGPHVYFENGRIVKDSLVFTAGFHPPVHDFLITIREQDHPITKGLPESWLQPSDDLYSNLRGPAKNLTILATAYSDTIKGPRTTGKHEPMLYKVYL